MMIHRFGAWWWAWVGMMLLLALPTQASVYRVDGVDISVPLPQPQNIIPQQFGLEQAKQEAFRRLQSRMLTPWDRDTLKEVLQGAAKEVDKYLQGVVLRSEKRRASRLDLVVDVTFSRQKVSQVFSNLGFSYCETPAPDVLLAVVRPGPGGSRLAGRDDPMVEAFRDAGRREGLNMVLPLGDVDDTLNLTMERLAAADGGLLSWAAARYKVGAIWWLSESGAATQGGWSLSRIQTPGELERVELALRRDGDPQGALQEMALVRVREAQERWVKAHLVVPDMHQTVRLRIIHPPQPGVYAKFHRGLRQLPGVRGVRVARMRVGETLLDMEFQGQPERLLTQLAETGAEAMNGDAGEILVQLRPVPK